MKIYFANALFSQADINYNAQLAAQIRNLSPQIELYLPQENNDINDKQAYADSKMIAQADTEKLLASDLVIAILCAKNSYYRLVYRYSTTRSQQPAKVGRLKPSCRKSISLC